MADLLTVAGQLSAEGALLAEGFSPDITAQGVGDIFALAKQLSTTANMIANTQNCKDPLGACGSDACYDPSSSICTTTQESSIVTTCSIFSGNDLGGFSVCKPFPQHIFELNDGECIVTQCHFPTTAACGGKQCYNPSNQTCAINKLGKPSLTACNTPKSAACSGKTCFNPLTHICNNTICPPSINQCPDAACGGEYCYTPTSAYCINGDIVRCDDGWLTCGEKTCFNSMFKLLVHQVVTISFKKLVSA